MSHSIQIPYVSPQNLPLYLSEIRKIPLLEPGPEDTLAKRWKEHDDPEAAQKLITSHLRLVAKIAKGFRGYGIPLDELISEGNIGLMKAVERFEPGRGFRLATYAMNLIANEIKQYIPLNFSVVKPPNSSKQRKAFYNLGRLLAARQDYSGGELSPETAAAIGKEMGVSAAIVISARRRAGGDFSLNERVRGEDNEEGSERGDHIADEAPTPEDKLIASRDRKIMNARHEQLKEVLGGLDDRSRGILVDRRLREEPRSLANLSQRWGISKERVRQIEFETFDHVERTMRRAVLIQKFEKTRLEVAVNEARAKQTRPETVSARPAIREKGPAAVSQIPLPQLPAPRNRHSELHKAAA